MEKDYIESLLDSQTGSGEDLEPEVIEMARQEMAKGLGLPENASLDEIDQAMIKKYLVT